MNRFTPDINVPKDQKGFTSFPLVSPCRINFMYHAKKQSVVTKAGPISLEELKNFSVDIDVVKDKFCLIIDRKNKTVGLGDVCVASVVGHESIQYFCAVKKQRVEIDFNDDDLLFYVVDARSYGRFMPRFRGEGSELERSILGKALRICKKKNISFMPSHFTVDNRVSSQVTSVVRDCKYWMAAYEEDME